jgi:hypothetical protein
MTLAKSLSGALLAGTTLALVPLLGIPASAEGSRIRRTGARRGTEACTNPRRANRERRRPKAQPAIVAQFGRLLDVHKASTAPVGSAMMLKDPYPGTSVTSLQIVAPSDLAFSVASVTLSTST